MALALKSYLEIAGAKVILGKGKLVGEEAIFTIQI